MTALLSAAPKFSNSDYAGFGPTIQKVAAYIRECGDDPAFQKFASKIVDARYPRSRHTTSLEVAQCLLDYCNENIRFRPDPPQTERVTSPRVLLCTSGEGAACIPVEDCESQVAAFLALCRAMGIDVWILLQVLRMPNGEEEHHMAGVIRGDDGSLVKVDPSLKGKSRIGEVQPSIHEETVDPIDPQITGAAGGAKLVTIGASLWKYLASSLKCSTCKHYAWLGAHMQPVIMGGQPHHPSCPFVSRRAFQIGVRTDAKVVHPRLRPRW